MQTRRRLDLCTRATGRQDLRARALCLFQDTRIHAQVRVGVMVLVGTVRMWILIMHALQHIRRPRTIRRRRDTMQIRFASRTAATTTEAVVEVVGAGDTAFQEVVVVGMVVVVREVQEVEGYIIRAWRARRCGDPR